MTTVNLQQCKVCTKRKFSPSVGLICGLTMDKPNFIDRCEEGVLDEAEALRLEKLQAEAQEAEVSGGFFGPEKQGMRKGVLGGVVMILIAIVWFVGGLAADIIFYYPPILFVIGLVALVKGIMDGNLAGKKK